VAATLMSNACKHAQLLHCALIAKLNKNNQKKHAPIDVIPISEDIKKEANWPLFLFDLSF